MLEEHICYVQVSTVKRPDFEEVLKNRQTFCSRVKGVLHTTGSQIPD
jgi:hypothetical protein